MPKKPIIVGVLSLMVAVTAYMIQAPTRAGERDVGIGVRSGGGAEAMDAAKTRDDDGSSHWRDADWDAFAVRVRAALADRLDLAPMGETVAAVGRSFVGTAYVPHTLEADGPEHVVIDFLELDCVTFVENALALARFVHLPDAGRLLDERGQAELRYEALLREIRYRDGVLDGYPSRLHYFSEWIADAQAKGLVSDITGEVGGVEDPEPLDFMSTHPDAYRQLADASNLHLVRETEARLSRAGRRYIPQDRIAAVSSSIHDGDIIAATSTVAGLDVAHTGLAIRVGGSLRLLHAPLVGDSVQISETTLAERIGRIAGQDGIMVARPRELR